MRMEGFDLLQTVRADHAGEPLFLDDGDDQAEELVGSYRVDGASGLIEDQDAGAVEDGTGELESCPHPGGEGEHGMLGGMGEPDLGQGVIYPPFEILAFESLQTAMEAEVLDTGEAAQAG